MYNIISLWKGTGVLNGKEFKMFDKGDSIIGVHGLDRELLKDWQIHEFTEANKELEKYKCEYRLCGDGTVLIEEYGLEYYTINDEGQVIDGSEFDFAETINRYQVKRLNNGSELKLELFDSCEDAYDYIQGQYAYDFNFNYDMENITYWIYDILTNNEVMIKWKEMSK